MRDQLNKIRDSFIVNDLTDLWNPKQMIPQLLDIIETLSNKIDALEAIQDDERSTRYKRILGSSFKDET